MSRGGRAANICPGLSRIEADSLPCAAFEPGASFGHFCAEVPKSPHIRSYPRALLIAAVCRAVTKSLQGNVAELAIATSREVGVGLTGSSDATALPLRSMPWALIATSSINAS